MALKKEDRRLRIKRRIRKTVTGTAERPRLTVFRSNKHMYAQLVDDVNGVTLGNAGSLKDTAAQGIAKIEQAAVVGKTIAAVAKAAGIESVVFDRNGYLYHGRVKSVAEAAREAGLKF